MRDCFYVCAGSTGTTLATAGRYVGYRFRPRLSRRERSSSFLERIRDNLMLPSCADYEAYHSNGLDAALFPGTPVLESFNISLSRKRSSLSSIRSSTQLSTLRANNDLLASAPSAASTPVLSPRNSRQQATPTAGTEIISHKDIPGGSDSVDGQKSDRPLKLVFVTALEHRTSSDITMCPPFMVPPSMVNVNPVDDDDNDDDDDDAGDTGKLKGALRPQITYRFFYPNLKNGL